MKIIVTGGRDFLNWQAVKETLDKLKPTLIVHGDASGADALAKRYAIQAKIPHDPIPAMWLKFGKSAGPIRNSEMLFKHKDADLVVAFPGGNGTRDCICKAKEMGLIVLQRIV